MKNTQKKFLSAVLAASSVAGVVAPAVTTFAATASEVETLVANALKDKTFYSFNVAYGAIVSLPAADQGKYLSQIAPLEAVVKTADIANILTKIDSFYATQNVETYDEIFYKLIPKVATQVDRDYLSYELYKYGKPFYETKQPDYAKATDAIIAVDKAATAGKTADARGLIEAAQTAIAKVTHTANNTYLKAALAEVISRMPAGVSSVKVQNSVTLNVKLDGKVAGLTIDKADFEVKVDGSTANILSAEKVSDTEYKLTISVAITDDAKVVVNGLSDLVGSTASDTYKAIAVSKIEAIETSVYTDKTGQYLKVKVDGVEMTADQLAAQGYDVVFQVKNGEILADDEDITSPVTTNTTGRVVKIVSDDVDLDDYEDAKYKVSITKDNETITSDYADVHVYEKGGTALSAISSTVMKVTNGESKGSTVLIDKFSSNKLIVGEYAEVTEVKATLQDGRTAVDLTDLTDSGLEFESSDVTVATVSDDGVVTAIGAGDVTITITSGSAKKEINLKILADTEKNLRKPYTATGTTSVKATTDVVDSFDVTFRDQYGDVIYADQDFIDTLIVDEATDDGDVIATAELKYKGSDAKKGLVKFEYTTDSTNTGNGSIVVTSDEGKTLFKASITVGEVTGKPTFKLEGDDTEIDLYSDDSKHKDIEFKLNKYLDGYSAGVENMAEGGYRVEVYDANEDLITDNATFNEDGNLFLYMEQFITNNFDQNADGSGMSLGDGVELKNFETGKGLVKVYDENDLLIASKSFTISDTVQKLTGANFASAVEFSEDNADELNLKALLKSVSVSGTAFDGVVRYEIDANDSARVHLYFDKAAKPNGFGYAADDVYLGDLVATAVNGENIEFITSSKADDYEIGDIETIAINSESLEDGDKVQFNLYKRGGKTTSTSVAKVTIKADKDNN